MPTLIRYRILLPWILGTACFLKSCQEIPEAATKPKRAEISLNPNPTKIVLDSATILYDKNDKVGALQILEPTILLSSVKEIDSTFILCHLLAGKILNSQDLADSARIYFRKASAFSHELGDSTLQLKCIEQIARTFNSGITYYDSILHYSLWALNYATLLKDSTSMMLNYYSLARTYDELGYESKAMENTLEALYLAEKKKDTAMIIKIRVGQAIVLGTVEQYAEARSIMESAIRMQHANIDSTSNEFLHSRAVLAWLYEIGGKYDSLFLTATVVLAQALKNQETLYIAASYYQQAVFYNKKNSPDTAIALLTRSANIYNDIDFLANVYREKGHAHLIKNNFSKASYWLNKSIDCGNQVHARDELRDSYKLLWQVYKRWDKYKPALQAYEQYNRYADSVEKMNNITAMHLIETKYEFDQKDEHINLLSAENQIKTFLAQKESQRKNLALIGICVLLLMSGYGFYWFRKRKQLQNETNLQKERLRISRELHDEVGATLSGVAMYSHLTKTQLQSQDLSGVENSLNIMQDSSAQMVNKLNDIVWLINPDKGSLADLMQRLEEYARQMAAAKNMEVKTEIAENIHQHRLSVEQRRNIYLFCKEAINNAVKYSEGTLLVLSVTEKENKLEFRVRDNGKGFDEAIVRRGNGLNNMQQRAEEIGAVLMLKSKKGEGSVLSIQIAVA